MTRPKPSCTDCKNRTMNCHSECESYKDYRNKLDMYNEVIKKAKKDYGLVYVR